MFSKLHLLINIIPKDWKHRSFTMFNYVFQMLLKLNQTVEQVLELPTSLLSPAQNVAVVPGRREP